MSRTRDVARALLPTVLKRVPLADVVNEQQSEMGAVAGKWRVH